MIAPLQLLHTLPGCYGEERFGEISLAESRDSVLIDVAPKGQDFFQQTFRWTRRCVLKTTVNLVRVRLYCGFCVAFLNDIAYSIYSVSAAVFMKQLRGMFELK